MEDKTTERSHCIQLYYEHCMVSTIGGINDRAHPNVLRLSLDRGPFGRVLAAVASRLPRFLQRAVSFIWPSLLLPTRLIVKTLKQNWDNEFENERKIYKKLQPLQGTVIPRFYGDAICEGRPAIVLSEVVGILPFQQDLPPLPRAVFQKRVEVALQELRNFSLSYEDVKLDNLLLVEDRLVLVDLESVSEPSPEDMEAAFNSDVYNLMLSYDRYLKNCHNNEW